MTTDRTSSAESPSSDASALRAGPVARPDGNPSTVAIEDQRGLASRLSVQNLHVDLITQSGVVTPVRGVSFDLRTGETLGVVGESGSGKTVTMLAILRLLPPAQCRLRADKLTFDGRDMLSMSDEDMRRLRGREVGFVFQNPMTALDPVQKVGAQIGEAIRIHDRQLSRDALKQRAVDLLDAMQIPQPARCYSQYPHQLSGGMAQRAVVAAAVANSPSLLIADEATTALDVTVQREVLSLLQDRQKEARAALILITHDLSVIAEWADRVVVFYAGRAVETGDVSTIFTSPRHPYTIGLLEAQPSVRGSVGSVARSLGNHRGWERFRPGARSIRAASYGGTERFVRRCCQSRS
jgi:ABC-type dipeptide/oligopeptide/nickel transport system ATPase component